MKRNLLLLLCIFILFKCTDENEYIFVDNACGVDNPTENIEWIKELVAKSKTDTTGNYQGTIYLEEHEGSDIVFVQMMMGSGGVIGYWYNCDGTIYKPSDDFELKRNRIIYSTIIKQRKYQGSI